MRSAARADARAHVAVVAAALLFGSTFGLMKEAAEDAGPVPLLAIRFLLGAVVLAPFARRRPPGLDMAGPAVACGAALLGGYVFQTVGLQYTSGSVSAFITYLLVVIVPLVAAVSLRRVPTHATLTGVVLATVGLWLLTGPGKDAGFGRGEALTLGCALLFAVHIVLLAEASPRFDALRLTAAQLWIVGLACVVPGVFLGGYRWQADTWLIAVYTGAAVSALALLLQIWGQRRVGPTRTALLLMIEPVAAAGFGYAAGDRVGWAGAAGAALILAGIAVAEIPSFLTARSTTVRPHG